MKMDKKYCVVCGEEIFGRSKKYCSRKCQNKAYFRSYYKNNKDEVINKNMKWYEENKEKAKEYMKKYSKKRYNEMKERKEESV